MLRTETGNSDIGFQGSEFFTPERETPRPLFGKKAFVTEDAERQIGRTQNSVLNALPRPVFKSLEPAMKRLSLQKEEFLFQPDDDPDFIYFPETAAVSEFQILEDGRMVEVAIIGREGAIGLSKLFCSAKIPNCVQVSQAGNVIRVNLSEARKTVRQNPEIAFYFYPFVDAYIRQISQKTVCNLYHSVRARFCTWLLMVQDRCENSVLELTHEQIARTLGVYRPRITCIARELKKNKVINYSRGGISICDRSEIERTACDCYHEIRDFVDLVSMPEAGSTLH